MQLEFESTLRTLNNALKTVRRSVQRLEGLERMEEALVNKGDKMAGRNTLHLRWGGKRGMK